MGPTVAPGLIMAGMAGGIVTFAQEMLIGLGYSCGEHGADGVFGPATTAAVQAFQAAAGLDTDGHGPGPAPAGSAAWPGRYLLVASPMMAGDDVREVQGKLSERGYGLGSGGVDGIYGPATESSVLGFQLNCMLQRDGVVGPVTWDALEATPTV